MIKGIGIDAIEINRLKLLIDDYQEHAIERLFTKKEIENCQGQKIKYYYYSGRFAAKEAAMKALGEGLRSGISWQEIEITNDKKGKPILNFYGKALKYAKRKKVTKIEVSISHSKTIAVAVVILF